MTEKPERRPGMLILRILAILLIALIAFSLRYRAILMLPPDYDEPVYVLLAEDYAHHLQEGNFGAIIADRTNYEHPQFFKIVYALVLSTLPQNYDLHHTLVAQTSHLHIMSDLDLLHFETARLTATAINMINIVLVSAISPAAGLFFAIHTYTIKYTAQAYLEALPMLTLTLAVLAYLKSDRRWNGWLILSSAMLGMTAASKYIYALVGLAVVADWAWHILESTRPLSENHRAILRQLRLILLWGGLALAAFFVFNPTLWPNPVGNLLDSVQFNVGFQQGDYVAEVGYPWYQPFIWLVRPVPWHPEAIFTWGDDYVVALALLGSVRMWKRQRIYILWWIIGMAFLLIWGTKWPQYILIVTVPVMLTASQGIWQIWDWVPDTVKSITYYTRRAE